MKLNLDYYGELIAILKCCVEAGKERARCHNQLQNRKRSVWVIILLHQNRNQIDVKSHKKSLVVCTGELALAPKIVAKCHQLKLKITLKESSDRHKAVYWLGPPAHTCVGLTTPSMGGKTDRVCS